MMKLNKNKLNATTCANQLPSYFFLNPIGASSTIRIFRGPNSILELEPHPHPNYWIWAIIKVIVELT
jgi:hypothetical protein